MRKTLLPGMVLAFIILGGSLNAKPGVAKTSPGKSEAEMEKPKRGKNVLGQVLEDCSVDPMTGFYRDGCCRTDEHDRGSHTVCCQVTAEFLAFSRSRGNDLTTPAPEFRFPGLRPGDSWCLCASRWKEAYMAGVAPPVRLESTHEKTLRIVPMEWLLEHALSNSTPH